MNLCKKIGKRVRQLRQSQGVSQEMLAHNAGIDRSYLSEIENGHKNLSVLVLEQIAVALDIEIKELF